MDPQLIQGTNASQHSYHLRPAQIVELLKRAIDLADR
jgi:hypothetical protein